MFPDTNRRVADNTCEHINQQIQQQIRENISKYSHASPDQIAERLEELDQEWDIERTLEANAASFALGGLILGASVDRKWFLFPGVIATFLLQHAFQGWCPPLPIFRRLGIRTAAEINQERYALKALRGDFDRVVQSRKNVISAQEVLAAAKQ